MDDVDEAELAALLVEFEAELGDAALIDLAAPPAPQGVVGKVTAWFSRTYGLRLQRDEDEGGMFDEAELEAEFAALEEELLLDLIARPPAAPAAPIAPLGPPAAEEGVQEIELRRIEPQQQQEQRAG
jgi:hypothetical protein